MTNDQKINCIVQSFREVNQVYYKQLWKNANSLGVTTLQLQILRILDLQPNISLVDLANQLNTGKSTVSETVERLVKANYVERKRSEQDRRVVVMTLTQLGQEKKAEAYIQYVERLSGLQEINEEDIEKLIELHKKIINKLLDGDEQQ
ncbi:MarR family winged helix-turn-helix transcriptional regulator [Radiobacillus sp. PE A8.2]|uniref:MarR family winged helix-turn-helix transcriptional regulator n=1 Tax=Radiobacillus sp. PE A8.2 TaxID=3380349 RepID=UPI00388CEF30